jgi:ribosomal-protein-alanine N-acetyltransferase
MNAFHIRLLHAGDAGPLLRFEQDNRAWFEQHIAARGPAFYSAQGVDDHIREFLDAHAAGIRHPCVILDGAGAIVGRANLKDIDRRAGSAEVGYRIAKACAGHGLATQAVRYLVEQARSIWQLQQLVAYVAPANRASARVLEKCAFLLQPGGSGDMSGQADGEGAAVLAYRLILP